MPLYKMMYRKPRIQKSETTRVRCMHSYTSKVLMYARHTARKSIHVYTRPSHVMRSMRRLQRSSLNPPHLLSHLVKRAAWHSPPEVGICVRLPPHRTRAGTKISPWISPSTQSLPQSLAVIVDQEHDLHTITGVFN